MFYLESNGFAATRWLAKSLSSLEGVECYHGTRAPFGGKSLGSKDDLDANGFIAHLAGREQNEGGVFGAVHSQFPIGIQQAIHRHQGFYGVLVRHPLDQIRSCYAWSCKAMESGKYFSLQARELALACSVSGHDCGIRDVLFANAMLSIIDFDLWVFQHRRCFHALLLMERFTRQPAYFSTMVRSLSGNRCQPDAAALRRILSGADDVDRYSHIAHISGDNEVIWSDAQSTMLVLAWQRFPILREVYDQWGYVIDHPALR